MMKFKIVRCTLLILICVIFVSLIGCEGKKNDYEKQKDTETENQDESHMPLMLPISEIIEYFNDHPEERDYYTGG